MGGLEVEQGLVVLCIVFMQCHLEVFAQTLLECFEIDNERGTVK